MEGQNGHYVLQKCVTSKSNTLLQYIMIPVACHIIYNKQSDCHDQEKEVYEKLNIYNTV